MDNMLVAVFETERQASAAARAMKELSTEGVVLVYASAVIVKGFKRIAIVNFAHDQNSRDPALATATRSLIGLLGRSWQSAEEATAECTTDLMLELANVGVDGGFLDKVSRHLLPGTAAIVSEIDEERLTPIDTLLESQGGIGFRCVRREVMDAQIANEIDALHREIHIIEGQLLHMRGQSKDQMQVMLKVKKDRLQATKDRARYRAASIKLEAEAKIVSLQERAAKAEGGIKARLERLANEVRVDYVNRATTLNLSWKIGSNVFQMFFLVFLLG
jgi:uncharacterized membrane protein